MSRWIRPGEPAWAALFTDFVRSAYRLEAQQIYSNDAEDAGLAHFLAGEPHGVDLSWSISKLTQQIAAGRTQASVRVVIEPPTDYTRFELSLYPEFVAAGEDLRIISVTDGSWPDDLPRHDYWLFDDCDVWRMYYGADHRWTGAELVENEEAIADHLRWRDAALARAVPLREYLAARVG
jgi:hypothetical protein